MINSILTKIMGSKNDRMLKKLLAKVLQHVEGGRFTPGAITRRDYGTKTVPADHAK